MTDPIRQSLATSDDCELGRLMRVHYSEMLAGLAGPNNPYGGGGVESRHAQSAGSADPECGSDGVRVAPYPNRVNPSRTSALPASTLSTYGANAQADARDTVRNPEVATKANARKAGDQHRPLHHTLPHPAPPAATQPSEGGGVGPYSDTGAS